MPLTRWAALSEFSQPLRPTTVFSLEMFTTDGWARRTASTIGVSRCEAAYARSPHVAPQASTVASHTSRLDVELV